MASLLSSLVDNLAEGIANGKTVYLDLTMLNTNYQYLTVSNVTKTIKKYFKGNLVKKFANIYKFCDRDIGQFCLILKKGVCSYEYMDTWERFNKRSLRDKKKLYSSLNIEGIIDEDYKHAKRVWKDFTLINLSYDRNLLLLADVFKNFRNRIKFIGIYKLDPAHF